MKILIADDEMIECRTLERMIGNRFADIDILPSVYDGISLVKSIETLSPDIVIADINMPGINGLEALELIHARKSSIQVIINTAYSDFAFAQRAIKCGACDYVLKPCNKEEILRAVEDARLRIERQRRTQNNLMERQQEKSAWNSVLEREVINSLIMGEVNAQSFTMIRRERPVLANGGAMLAILAKNAENENGPSAHSLYAQAHSILSRLCFCFAREYQGGLYALIMFEQKEGAAATDVHLREIAQILYENAKAMNAGGVSIGLSRVKREDAELPQAFLECRAACRSTQGGVQQYAKDMQVKDGAPQIPEELKVRLNNMLMNTEKAEKNLHVRKAMNFIRQNYMKDISLEDVAKACDISSFYLSRLLKQSMDMNFVGLLTDVRMERAMKMLEQGGFSNREIAEAVGYSSSSYFHKVFKRKTGMALGDYRIAIGEYDEDDDATEDDER